MGGKTYDLGGGGTSPADESIDEALARLARQDSRRSLDGSVIPTSTTQDPSAGYSPARDARPPSRRPSLPVRAPWSPPTPPTFDAGPVRVRRVTRPTAPGPGGPVGAPITTPRRNGVLSLVRWAIILGGTWVAWRYFLR